MKLKNCTKLTIIGLFSFFTLHTFAQTHITISDSITVVDQVKYFVHKIQKKETLYSIGKAYQCSVEEIIEHNPGAKDGLSIDEYLQIPFRKQVELNNEKYVKHSIKQGETLASIAELYNVAEDTIVRYNPEVAKKLSINQLLLFPVEQTNDFDPNYVYHKVKPKETLYSLSKLYGVKIRIIEKNNPQLEENPLQIGEYIKIPKRKVDFVDKIPSRQEDKYIYHRVERKQTLYSISKIYGIDIAAIVAENEDLQKRGLISGEILKIPNEKFVTTQVKDTIPSDSVLLDSIIPKEIKAVDCIQRNVNSERSIQVALLLPFYTSINSAINSPKDEDEEEDSESMQGKDEEDDAYKIYNRSKIFIDFYQGCLVALKDLKNRGYDIELHVFDTENDTSKVKEIIYTNKLENADLILGPVFSENLELVSNYSKENDKLLISPLSTTNTFLAENPYAFQVSPNFNQLSQYAADFLLGMSSRNYIIVHDQDNFDNEFVQPFKKAFYSAISKELSLCKYHLQEIGFYSAQDSVFDYSLIDGKENIVIIPYSNQAFVSSVLSKLNAYAPDYEIKVFGMPRWRKFDNIEPDIFHNLEVHLFTNFYLDYEQANVKAFIGKFRNYFKSEPNNYSYMGYDIFLQFIEAYNEYGQTLPHCINEVKTDCLVTDFYFKHVPHKKGLSNTAVYLLFYNHEFDIKILKTYRD